MVRISYTRARRLVERGLATPGSQCVKGGFRYMSIVLNSTGDHWFYLIGKAV